jgi:two-component sensor histidine kinase
MPNRKPRILIIDDDKGFCKLVSKHLVQSGFETVCAHSAKEGLASALREAIDVIVLDHVLPEQDGIRLLSVLKGRQEAPPVVYLTDNQDSRVAVAALKAGAADHVVKDLHGDFLLLLENAVTNAMFAAAIKRDKEKAEAEVRAARDQFQALAEERALLLREVSHRVGNSLQLIASLLHFQGDMSGNEDVKAALREANSRVLAVARVHRSLYTSLDVRWISLADYLSNLIRDLEDAAVAGDGDKSSISFSSDPILAGPDTAVALGIVAAELILNALKHAYPGGCGGPVRVSLRASASKAELVVEDHGIGGVDDAKNGRQRGLGQRIIAGMADKLNGSFCYEPMDRGTRAVMTFPAGDDIQVLSAKQGNAA